MMDTVLNLGLNDDSVRGLIARTGNERFGWDSYRRFVQMFGSVVRGIDGALFERAIKQHKERTRRGVRHRPRRRRPRGLTRRFKQIFEVRTGEDFPQDPREQLRQAIRAVFDSWNGDARGRVPAAEPHPRRLGHRGERAADGVRQQGRHSASGVAFSRDETTGAPQPVGRLPRRTRRARTSSRACATRSDLSELAELMPEVARAADRHPAHARAPLPRHAGRRVHDRGGDALHAADAQREAPRAGGRAGRRRHGRRGPADDARRRCCGSSRRSSTRCCTRRSTPTYEYEPLARGVPASPGAAKGRDRVHRRRGGRAGGRRART